MKKYFSTRFYLAQFNKPAEFPNLMVLQLHNFAVDKLADNYTSYKSYKQCREFINYIAADKDILEKIFQSWMMTALFQYSLMFVPMKQMLSRR